MRIVKAISSNTKKVGETITKELDPDHQESYSDPVDGDLVEADENCLQCSYERKSTRGAQN